MITQRCSRLTAPFLLMVATMALVVAPARAHIMLDAPNGGEQLEVGSSFTVTWHILIQHNQLNWDVWYSTVSNAGPWITVATNLRPGSFSVGSVHTYEWTIPDDVDDSVWVRVRMDNAGTDYYDVNNAPFSIVPAAIPGDIDGNGIVSTSDLLLLLGAWGPCENCKDCPADLDDNCVVSTSDLLTLLGNWG